MVERLDVRHSRDALPENHGQPSAESYASPSRQRSYLHCYRIHQRYWPRDCQVFISLISSPCLTRALFTTNFNYFFLFSTSCFASPSEFCFSLLHGGLFPFLDLRDSVHTYCSFLFANYFVPFLFIFQWSRQLAESGAHVVMAVRNPKAALDLIQKWQNEWSGMGLPLNIEVSNIHNVLLSFRRGIILDSVALNQRNSKLQIILYNF